MKRSLKLTAVSVLALALAGGLSADLLAESNPGKGTPATEQSAAKNGDVAQEVAISEHGMAAINDIQLARLAINDGYTDNAAKLLKDAKKLLKQVKEEDQPAMASAQAKTGDKQQKKTETEKPDMVPILSEIGFVEALAATPASGTQASGTHAAKPETAQTSEQTSSQQETGKQQKAEAAGPTREERVAAAQKAREQWRKGDRQGAIETLKPVELGLVTRTIDMPLTETNKHLDQAISLLDKGKYHEANLALKKIEDGLVVATDVVIEPAGKAAASDTGKATGNESTGNEATKTE
ncbi:MAG: YfdX family protein [Thiohalocapsa sp.]|jgi:hypothetical protein|uniref:YfdX family protein n=1 Tax=Thiohalocapsa sp. TaxID=2497641 RepID=UPI0025DD16B2|nr:YfdX family protein [Thiohalocapsa sp.]MCG6940224.1 YfdX family protein [Thiohalocapsa sp.]